MQIQLKQQHIEAAIKAYVAKAGIQFPIDKIDFTAGRGKDGLTATIEMDDPFLVADDQPQLATNKTEPAKPKAEASVSKASPGEHEAAVMAEKEAKAEKQKEAEKTALATNQVSKPENEAVAPGQEDDGQEPPKKSSLFGG